MFSLGVLCIEKKNNHFLILDKIVAMQKILYLIIGVIGSLLLSSCAPSLTLFGDNAKPISRADKILEAWQQTPTLQPGSKITVSIWDHEDLSVGSQNSQQNSGEQTGRWLLLDAQGEINLPKIGRIKLSGYNVKEASYILEKAYATQIQNPIVNIRVLNQYVTVLGEVLQPGVISLNDDNMTLEQLIGATKGFTDYANVKRVTIIRETKGDKQMLYVDMTQLNALRMSVKLLPDDVVYVPPTPRKNFNKIAQEATPIAAVVSTLAVVVSILLRK